MAGSTHMPSAALIVRSHVADFDKWKAVFDAHEPGRRDHGIDGHHINRAEDDPNRLTIYFPVSDLDGARAYFASDEVKAAMAEAGVQGPPDFDWVKPLRQQAVLDRDDVPAMLVTHRVDDVDGWLAVYDGADDMRSAGGIIGHAVNQDLSDPARLTVYHQAESLDTLKTYAHSEDLKIAMKEAGVTSEPEMTFHTGGWGKSY